MKRFLLIVALAASVFQAFSDGYHSWSYSQRIYVNTSATGAGVTTDQLQYPLLVRLNPSNFRHFALTKPLGADIRFAKADGSPLSYQIERWVYDSVNRNDTAEIWVKVDTVYGNDAAQYITMFYGNASAHDSSNGAAVFDTANGFVAVYHLNDGKFTDATFNRYDGTPSTSGATPSIIGKGQDFIGDDDRSDCGKNAGSAPNLTVAYWMRSHVDNTYQRTLGKIGSSKPVKTQGWTFLIRPSGESNQIRFRIGDEHGYGTWGGEISADYGYAKNKWGYVVATYDFGITTGRLFIDGTLKSSVKNTDGRGVANSANPLYLGKDGTLEVFDGELDEVRISNIPRSSDWIKLCYENQKINQTLVAIDNCLPIEITLEPKDITVKSGDPAWFSISVADGEGCSYQWLRRVPLGPWNPIVGATSPTYEFMTVDGDAFAEFCCAVAKCAYRDTSDDAVLRLCIPPTIQVQPINVYDMPPGETVTFAVTASGSGVSFQWERSDDGGSTWAPVAGATRSSFSLQVVSEDDQSKFRCRVYNACGTILSEAKIVTVCSPVTIVLEPENQAVIENQNAQFTLRAEGTNRSYEWQRKNGATGAWEVLPGAIDAFCILTGVSVADSGSAFRCLVRGKCGLDTSREVSLAVYLKVKARFTMSDSIGERPLSVTFTDASSGAISSWRWNFGDGRSESFTTPKSMPEHAYDSAAAYTVDLVVQGPGGIDSASRTLKVYSPEGNPILISGRRLAPDSVELVLKNFSRLRSSFPPPFVSKIKLWSFVGALPTDTIDAELLKSYSLATFNPGKGEYRDTVRVQPLLPGDSVYGFSTQIVWNDNRTTQFLSNNGCTVFMRDTAKPANALVVSGRYAPWDTVVWHLDGIQTIDTMVIDSVGLWHGVGTDSVPDFGNKANVQWWSSGEIVRGAAGSRISFVMKKDQFNTDRKALHGAVVVVGNNRLRSRLATCSFTIGRVRPQNPLLLHAVAKNSSSIALSWGRLKPKDSVERIRIYYRAGAALPLHNDFSNITVDSIVPEPGVGDTAATAFRLSEKRRYFFGAQVYRQGLWSQLTYGASASDSTFAAAQSTIANTISITSAVFDSATNNVQISWSVDTIAGSGQLLGVSVATSSEEAGNPRESAIRKTVDVLSPLGSMTINVNDQLLFAKDLYVMLWLKKAEEQWVPPTAQSTDTLTVPHFGWQTVRYGFDLDGDTTSWANDRIWFMTAPVKLLSMMKCSGKIQAFQAVAAAYEGFIVQGPGFRFVEQQPSDPFSIGFKCDSIPAGFRLQDIRIYRYANGRWLVSEKVAFDTVNSLVSTYTIRLDMPFIAMIDTTMPEIRVEGYSDTAVDKATRLTARVIISDNTGNVKWGFRCAKGGDPFLQGTILADTLFDGCDTIDLAIKDVLVDGDNGLRALLVADDGRNRDTVNLSRRVIREHSDARAVPAMQWTPLRVTAEIDSPAVSRLFRMADTVRSKPDYNRGFMRVFRWSPEPVGSGTSHWSEYGEEADSMFAMAPGRLFWVKTRFGVTFDFGRGVTTSLKDTMRIRLPGREWTDFALPFRFDTRVGDIITATRHGSAEADSLQLYRWIQDSSGRYHCEPLYLAGLNDAEFQDLGKIMSCHDDSAGYTVYNPTQKDLSLRIPPTPASHSSFAVMRKRSAAKGWVVKLMPVTGEGYALSPVYCGFRTGQGKTSFYPKAPQLEEVSVGVLDEKAGAVQGHQIEHVMNGGCSYLLVFGNDSPREQRISMRVSCPEGLPAQSGVVLYDAAAGKTTSPHDGTLFVNVGARQQEHRWLIVGDADYRAAAGKRYRSGMRFSLEAMYPNPLQARLTVRYSLPVGKSGTVECAVFDIRGREVWRTARTQKSAAGGRGELRWLGVNRAGKRVSGGVYLLSLTAYDADHRVMGSFSRRVTVLPNN